VSTQTTVSRFVEADPELHPKQATLATLSPTHPKRDNHMDLQ
jgi:hypothetical protein